MFQGQSPSFCFADAQAVKAAVLPQDTVRPAESAVAMLLEMRLPGAPLKCIGWALYLAQMCRATSPGTRRLCIAGVCRGACFCGVLRLLGSKGRRECTCSGLVRWCRALHMQKCSVLSRPAWT